MDSAEFDKFAREYRSLHQANIGASGEAPEYFAEYKMGCWILHRPVPLHRLRFHFGLHDYLNTGLFVRLVWPAFVGSLFFALPSAIIVYFLMRLLISRARTAQKID